MQRHSFKAGRATRIKSVVIAACAAMLLVGVVAGLDAIFGWSEKQAGRQTPDVVASPSAVASASSAPKSSPGDTDSPTSDDAGELPTSTLQPGEPTTDNSPLSTEMADDSTERGQGPDDSLEDSAEANGWGVRADPLPENLKFELEETPLAIPFPGEGRNARAVVFSSRPSPFVGLVSQTKSQQNIVKRSVDVEVYDLRKRSLVGTATVSDTWPRGFAIGPDGKHVTSAVGRRIQIQRLGKDDDFVELSRKDTSDFRYCDFIDAKRLLIVTGSPGKLAEGRCEVWNVESQTVEIEFNIPPVRVVAVSPGGRYLAAADDERIIIYRIATGVSCGECIYPPSLTRHGELNGLAFSLDGRQLAAMNGFMPTVDEPCRLWSWTMSDGLGPAELPLRDVPHFPFSHSGKRSGLPYEYFPPLTSQLNGDGWLVHGRTLHDSQTGGLLWSHDRLDDDRGQPTIAGDETPPVSFLAKPVGHPVRMLEAEMVFGLAESNGAWDLVGMPLGRSALAQVLADVRAGQTADPKALPPALLDSVARKAARKRRTDSAMWLVKPDGIDRPRRNFNHWTIPAFGRGIIRAAFASPESGLLALHHADRLVTDPDRVTIFAKEPTRLTILDTFVEESFRELEIPPLWVLCDISPSGDKVLLWNDSEMFEVRPVDGGPGARITTSDHRARLHGLSGKPSLWAQFLDEDTFVAHGDNERNDRVVVAWNIAGQEVQYVIDQATAATLSPGHHQLFVARGEVNPPQRQLNIEVFDSLTGVKMGQLKKAPVGGPGGPVVCTAMRVRPDGQRLAAQAENGLYIWDLTKGRHIKTGTGSCGGYWIDSKHLLINGQLWDTEEPKLRWTYKAGIIGTILDESPDGKIWVACEAREVKRDPKRVYARIAAVPLPLVHEDPRNNTFPRESLLTIPGIERTND